MKKNLAIVLVLIFVLSLAACGKKAKKASDIGNVLSDIETEVKEKYDDIEEILSSDISLDDVTSFDDFVKTMDDNGFKPSVTENDDGSVTIELNDSGDEDETVKPAIPTIDTIPEPTKPEPTVKPEPQPEKEEESQKQDEEKTPEVNPEPEKETETEPEVEPEIEPEVKPEPQPETPKKEENEKPAYTYTTNQKHTKVPYSERYLYSLLDEEKKGWYRAIDDAITNLQPRVEINTKLSEDRKYYIYYLYMFDNPEHFYLGNTVTIYNYGNNSGALVFCYSDGEMTCRYGSQLKEINDELRQRIRAKQAVFEKEVNRIISTIPANAPDVWKEKLIYDRILTDSYYNLSAKWDGIAEDNWTAYGILVNKHGVCESYAEAFQTLCLYTGINCTGVVGTAGGGHKWNCVKLDGEWYMCDVTFDDPIGGAEGAAYHYYFNLTSKQMQEYCHDWSDSNWPVPNCTATKYNYYNYFNN